MQNAVDIIAMVQKTSAPKPKFDVPGRTLAVERTSFKKELNEAKRDYSNNSRQDLRKADQPTQRTIEKRAEKLAKVMSNSNAKVEVKENTAAEANVQSEDVDQTKAALPIEAKSLEGLEEQGDDAVQATLEILQQLLQQLQGMQIQDQSILQTPGGENELHELVQKLDQMLKLAEPGQTNDLSKQLESIKTGLSEILKELSMVNQNPEQQRQTVQIAEALINKLNELEPTLRQKQKDSESAKGNHQMVLENAKTTGKLTVKVESEQDSKLAGTEATEDDTLVQKIDTRDTTERKEAREEKSNEHGHSSYDTKLNNNVKHVFNGDKLNQNSFENVFAATGEKLNVELNVKQVEVNLTKQSMVQISKSDIINQVVKKADINVQDGRQEMIMKLEPESLGKLNLKVSVENGIITAKFIAESQQVKEVLESSFNQLKDALQEKGIAVQSFSVSVGQEGREFNSQQGFDQWKRSIKLNSKPSGSYLELEDESITSINPYEYHEGKVDYKA